jgi:hypothetical protein
MTIAENIIVTFATIEVAIHHIVYDASLYHAITDI